MNIEYNVRGVLHAFFRQKAKVIAAVALFTLCGAVFVLRAHPVYEARGSLLVKFGQGARPDVNMPGTGPAEVSRSDRDEIMESNIGILQSYELLADVLSAMGVDKLYPDMAEDLKSADEKKKNAVMQNAVNRLRGSLDVRTDGGSNIIELHVRNEHPEAAARFADMLMDRFIIRQAEVYNASQSDFLTKQIADMKTRLDQSEREFLDFKKETGISAIDEEMSQLLAQKSSLTAVAFKSVADAQTTLGELEAKETEMRATYKAGSPVMKRLHDSIVLAQRQLRERQSDLNTAGNTENTDEDTAVITKDDDNSLSSKVAAIDTRIAWLEQQRGRYNELEQRVKMDQENYSYYQQRGEEARINNLLNTESITRISVIDRPVVPLFPVYPKKKLILLAFLMAGLLVGLGIALTFELLDDRITSPEQLIAGLELPVLATFGEVKGV